MDDTARQGELPSDPRTGESSVDLLRRSKAGDARALDELCRRYRPLIARWTRGRLPGYARGFVDTDDLVQETLLSTLRNVGTFEPRHDGALQAYLRQAVANRIRSEVQRSRRRTPWAPLQGDEPDPGVSPLERLVGRERFERYESALSRLREEDREAIIARIEMDAGYEELAAALGKPSADAARMAVNRALVRLAREMADAE
jgi:RNA polymerase sigma-70 factor (ECF subfamily)